jgi:hypothetical protein
LPDDARSYVNKGLVERGRQGCFERRSEAGSCFDTDEGIVLGEEELDGVLAVPGVDDLAQTRLAATRKVSLNNALKCAVVKTVSGERAPEASRHQI